ncbi:MAG: AAA family ATPase [Thermodesulfobacteriota bacterium]
METTMILESISVKNFRSIFDETLTCDNLTALVGANGAGKSSFLKALDLFYNPSTRVDIDDFYNKDTSKEISIALTFKELSEEAKRLFAKYVQNDKLTVERVFTFSPQSSKITAKYHGSSLQNQDFKGVRDALELTDRARKAKELYTELKTRSEYADLSNATTKDALYGALKDWEGLHSDRCVRERDDGQFFGFQEVGEGYLGRFTKFLFIPAIRDAFEDASESKGSAITMLMDLVVRSILINREELKELKQNTHDRYKTIMDPNNLGELDDLQQTLTDTLKTYVPGAGVELKWLPLQDINFPMPQADVKLVEDGYSSTVSKTGHGLQRAFILTLLQHLTLAQSRLSKDRESAEEESASEIVDVRIPNFIIAIEEPELYQHPSRQRHLAEIMIKLTSGEIPGVAEKTQIIYCTHSPLFVKISHIDQIRLVRKISKNSSEPKITRISKTTREKITHSLNTLDGVDTYTSTSLSSRLQAIMTPWMNEGFFADVVVLVEGEDDRAAILGVAFAMGHDFESQGIAVIPSGGKNNIDRPYLIFKHLEIPTYVLWDSDHHKGETEGNCETCLRPLDKKANPLDNRRILRMLEEKEEDWPNYIKNTSACFENDLETTLKAELGDALFDECLASCQREFGITKLKHAMKNPNFITHLIEMANQQEIKCGTIETIISNILALK